MQAFRWCALAMRAGLFGCASVLLASCGSGAVSGPVVSSGPIVISPSTAVLYSELPTTFALTGGNGNYIVTSSDQNVLPIAGSTTSNALVVIPNDVGSDTPVTINVRDSSGSAQATASLTVKPRTISNVVTITPSAGQSVACGTALCAGGDAEVRVTLAQLGVPLAGRSVQFDVVSGDLGIIASSLGGTEFLTASTTVVTDSSGTARIRVRAQNNAPPQTALLRITDNGSGFVQSATVSISPSTSTTMTVLPAAINFTGTTTTTCASGVSADVIVVGGRPPYQVTKPPSFNVNPTTLTTSGGHITVSATGQCARTGGTSGTTTITEGGQTMGVVDSNGASAIVTLHNDPAPATTPTAAFAVAPKTVTLGCNQSANVILVGGTPPYYWASGNANAVTALVAPGPNGSYVGTITRNQGTTASPNTATTPVSVAFSDGQTVETVTVNLTAGSATAPNTSTCP